MKTEPGDPDVHAALPKHRDLYYGGGWHRAAGYAPTFNPASGAALGDCAEADAGDVDRAAQAAHAAFPAWRALAPAARGDVLRAIAARLRAHAADLALIDAANCGNPVAEMTRDVHA
ncbi:MAG: aldehyde dehydrogenase family protein, partial [Betaproteobacteria bacterium]